jgi:hypothetical protein
VSRVVRGGSDGIFFCGAGAGESPAESAWAFATSPSTGRLAVSTGGLALSYDGDAGGSLSDLAIGELAAATEAPAAPPEKRGFVPISSMEPPASRSASSSSSAACFMTVCSCFGGISASGFVLGKSDEPPAGRGGNGIGAAGLGFGGDDGGEEEEVDGTLPSPMIVAFRNAAPVGGGAGPRDAADLAPTEAPAGLAAREAPTCLAAMEAPAGFGAVEGVGGPASEAPSDSASNARPASDFVFTNRSMTAVDGASILMNLTPMPDGRSAVDCAVSRFQTTRPTPAITAWSLARRISNLRSVPAGNGLGVLM